MEDDGLTWFKSSFSAYNGGCVEVAFRKSSFSAAGNCVEAALSPAGGVLVRDTKDRSRPAHEYTREEWQAFIRGAKAGEFDLP